MLAINKWITEILAVVQLYGWSFLQSYGTETFQMMAQHILELSQAEKRLIDAGLPPVRAVYLIGVLRSGGADGGFDQIDFSFDPRFGTEADVKEVIKRAHDNNMQIGTDFIVSHTSVESELAQKCLNGVKEYEDALIVVDRAQAKILTQNGVPCYFSGCQPFTFYKGHEDLAVRTKFRPEQPALNPLNAEVRRYLRNGIEYLRSLGFDFVRVDTPTLAFEDMSKADPANPFAGLQTARSLDYVQWLCDGMLHFDEIFFPEDIRRYEGRDGAYAVNSSFVLDGQLHLAEWQGSLKVVQNVGGHDQMPLANRGLTLAEVLPYAKGSEYLFYDTASLVGWKSKEGFTPVDAKYDADPNNPARRYLGRKPFESIRAAFRAQFLS